MQKNAWIRRLGSSVVPVHKHPPVYRVLPHLAFLVGSSPWNGSVSHLYIKYVWRAKTIILSEYTPRIPLSQKPNNPPWLWPNTAFLSANLLCRWSTLPSVMPSNVDILVNNANQQRGTASSKHRPWLGAVRVAEECCRDPRHDCLWFQLDSFICSRALYHFTLALYLLTLIRNVFLPAGHSVVLVIFLTLQPFLFCYSCWRPSPWCLGIHCFMEAVPMY